MCRIGLSGIHCGVCGTQVCVQDFIYLLNILTADIVTKLSLSLLFVTLRRLS